MVSCPFFVLDVLGLSCTSILPYSVRSALLDQALQNFYELRSGGLQFLQMVQRECLEKFFAVVSQLDENLPAIVGRAQAAKQASVDQTIDQFHGAVMLQLHPFRQNSDGRFKILRKTANREQELMLLRFDAGLARGVFAETQKPTDLIAQVPPSL